MKKHKIITFIAVAVIFILGLTLRLYRLDKNIPPLYADETGHYQFWALFTDPSQSIFTKVERLILYGPLSYTWFLGLSAFAARLPSAINGSLICLSAFLLAVAISQRLKIKNWLPVSLLVCLLSALLPWSFMMSRLFSHIPLMLFFVCLHLYLFIKSQTIKADLISLIPLFVGTYYYMSMTAIVPFALVLVFFSIYKRSLPVHKKYYLGVSAAIGSLFLYLFIAKFGLLDPRGRGLDLAIWNDVNVTADANKFRGLARQSEPTIFSFGVGTEKLGNKLVFNYPVSIINVFFKNYLSFFSPDFLFLKGDTVLRHSTGMVGQFFPFLLPFMLYGAFIFFKNADGKLRSIFLVWILVSPLPAAITKDGANYLLRAITLMPFLTYFSGLGLVGSVSWFKNKIIKAVYLVALLFIGLYSAYYFYFGYFHVYPALAAQSYEYGFKEISDFQVSNPGKILIVWEDKYPTLYFCFWQKLPTDVCDRTKLNSTDMINNTIVDLPLDSLLFSLPQNEIDLSAVIAKYRPQYLVIPSKYFGLFPKIEKSESLIQTIKYPDKTTAFSIYQVNKLLYIVK
jgi:hypothetical protein